VLEVEDDVVVVVEEGSTVTIEVEVEVEATSVLASGGTNTLGG